VIVGVCGDSRLRADGWVPDFVDWELLPDFVDWELLDFVDWELLDFVEGFGGTVFVSGFDCFGVETGEFVTVGASVIVGAGTADVGAGVGAAGVLTTVNEGPAEPPERYRSLKVVHALPKVYELQTIKHSG